MASLHVLLYLLANLLPTVLLQGPDHRAKNRKINAIVKREKSKK